MTSSRRAKLSDTATGDTLAPKGSPVVGPRAAPRPSPVLAVAIRPKSKGDEDKLMTALHRLARRGPRASRCGATTRPTRPSSAAWARRTWRSSSSG